jgi:hypothetical protein
MFGTDLQSAYAPFSASDNGTYADVFQMQDQTQQEIVHKSTPLSQIQHGNHSIPTQPIQQQTAPMPSTKQQLPSTVPLQLPLNNEQQDPRIAVLLNELRKQQKIVSNIENQNGYFDKLASKRKDVMRIIQLSLVIVLALSLHFIIDHYLKNYIKNNDLSFERELIIRALYPVAIVFVIWNMKAFVK